MTSHSAAAIESHTDVNFERTKTAVRLSLTGTTEMWRMFRTTNAPVSLIESLYPAPRGGRRTPRSPVKVMWQACETGFWDLDSLDEWIRGAINMQTPEAQAVFWKWQPAGLDRLAAMFETETQDWRLKSVHNLAQTVLAYNAYWANPTRGALVAVTPIWFDVCDIITGVSA